MAKDEKHQSKESTDEQIGFHKGALTTLAKERQELARILGIVEQLMQMHLKGLKDLGIDLEAEAKKVMDAKKTEKSEKTEKKKPLEEELL